jgi:hypothetical protein
MEASNAADTSFLGASPQFDYCGPNPAGRIPSSKPTNIRFSYITATTTKN